MKNVSDHGKYPNKIRINRSESKCEDKKQKKKKREGGKNKWYHMIFQDWKI